MTHFDDSGTRRANTAFISSSMGAPLLERDHELALAQRWREHDDQTALHELVTSYTRLAVSIATRFRHYGLPIGDLIQEGNLGLMQAAARFEAARNVRFSTYATWWIRARMQDFVLRNWSIVRAGTTNAQKSLFFNLRRLRARINDSGELLSQENRDKIAKALNVRSPDVVHMETRLSQADQSLNVAPGEDGREEWQDLVPDTRPDPEEVVAEAHDQRLRVQWLMEAMADLGPRERTVIHRRRLVDGDGVSLGELGKELGVSKERVRQIEARALEKLRDALLRRSKDAADLIPA